MNIAVIINLLPKNQSVYVNAFLVEMYVGKSNVLCYRITSSIKYLTSAIKDRAHIILIECMLYVLRKLFLESHHIANIVCVFVLHKISIRVSVQKYPSWQMFFNSLRVHHLVHMNPHWHSRLISFVFFSHISIQQRFERF